MRLKDCIDWFTNKIRRDTTSGQIIAEIDGLRFVAIFSVILFHINAYLSEIDGALTEHNLLSMFFSQGHVGVQLFFVISGFVIALPFAKGYFTGNKLPRLRTYFLRRLTRLEPPYIINLFILYVLTALATAREFGELLPHLFTSMGYIHNIIYGEGSVINPVAWSLEIELQFYVLAPFISKIFSIRSKNVRRLLLAGLIAIIPIAGQFLVSKPRFELSIFGQAQYFLTGFLLVDVYLTEFSSNSKKSLHWDIVSIFSWFTIVGLLEIWKWEQVRLILVVPIFLAYCAAFKGIWSNRLFSYPLIYAIGGMCYTIYLYHETVILVLGKIIIKSGLLNFLPSWAYIVASLFIMVPPILLISTVFFIFIEKPCMKKEWYKPIIKKYVQGFK